jgi:hypothetical protein
MNLQPVTPSWIRLDVGTYPDRITFFGRTEEEVKNKHKAYVRSQQHDLLPHVHPVDHEYLEDLTCEENSSAG